LAVVEWVNLTLAAAQVQMAQLLLLLELGLAQHLQAEARAGLLLLQQELQGVRAAAVRGGMTASKQTAARVLQVKAMAVGEVILLFAVVAPKALAAVAVVRVLLVERLRVFMLAMVETAQTGNLLALITRVVVVAQEVFIVMLVLVVLAVAVREVEVLAVVRLAQ